jgi:hypothetical protein
MTTIFTGERIAIPIQIYGHIIASLSPPRGGVQFQMPLFSKRPTIANSPDGTVGSEARLERKSGLMLLNPNGLIAKVRPSGPAGRHRSLSVPVQSSGVTARLCACSKTRLTSASSPGSSISPTLTSRCAMANRRRRLHVCRIIPVHHQSAVSASGNLHRYICRQYFLESNRSPFKRKPLIRVIATSAKTGNGGRNRCTNYESYSRY